MEPSLVLTPTWVVATVCLAIVAASLAAERLLQHLGKLLKRNGQKALFSALLRVKDELMLLGFISFLLTVLQGVISRICMPESTAALMLPCKKEGHGAAEEVANHCKKKGEVPLLSKEVLHQLHIFVFILGVVHVVFCATTMVLGGAQMAKWKNWEKEIHKKTQDKSAGQTENEGKATPLHTKPHRGEIVNKHTECFWMRVAVVRWMNSFLKQFYASVSKSDYRALRAAFVLIHYPNHPTFDFHRYMIRALEHDFKRVVGISWYLWLFVIIFLLLNVNGWHAYFWLGLFPLFLLLIVGAKLEHIITQLAQEAAGSFSDETEGAPKVKPSKEHFWFGKPEIVLHLIHFILFQNSFEIAFFFWVLATYGFNSCVMEKKAYAISRLVIGIAIQVLCSYSTLPLYAIVTHMGGDIKLEAFGKHVQASVHSWAADGRKKRRPRPNLRIPLFRKSSKSAAQRPAEVEATTVATEPVGSTRNTPVPPELEEIVTSTTTTTTVDARSSQQQ